MSCVLKIVGAQMPDGVRKVTESGQYLRAFDPDAAGGFGLFRTSPHLADALIFPDPEAALAFWSRQSKVKPLRDDGEPNRPLTGYAAMIIDLDAATEDADGPANDDIVLPGRFSVLRGTINEDGGWPAPRDWLLREVGAAEAMACVVGIIRGAPARTRLKIVDDAGYTTFEWDSDAGLVFPVQRASG